MQEGATRRCAQVALGLAAAVFLVGGVVFLFQPSLLGAIGIEGPGVDARNDLRAVYGGMEIGLGLFLALCLRGGSERLHIGLILAGLVFVAMVGARLFAVAVDGAPSRFVWGLGLAELSGALLCGAALAAMLRAERRA